MKLSDALRMSTSNLTRRKGRTALTLVGVVIGVAALVLMISLALGLEYEVVKLFQSDDALRTLFIARVKDGKAKKGGKMPNLFSFGLSSLPITDRELDDLRKNINGIATIIPDLNLYLNLDIEGESESDADSTEYVPIGGLPEEELPTMRKYLVAGSVWTDPQERAVLVPSRMLALRFQKKPAEILGKRFIFSRAHLEEDEPQPPPEEVTFRVVGVLDTERLGIKARQLYIPMSGALHLRELTHGGNAPFLIYRKGAYLSAEVKVRDVNQVQEVKQQLANSGFQVISTGDIMGTIGTIFLVIEGFMACIGAIGLIVSIFGIANTMAMAVLERTREIGIMKAIGARNSDIRWVFLMEAAAIGFVGGVLGLGSGAIGGAILNVVAHQFSEIPDDVYLFHTSLWLTLGSILFSMVVSMVAGFLPALRASRLDPVQALRYE